MKPPEPHRVDRMKDGLRKWRDGQGRDNFLVVQHPERGRGVVATVDFAADSFVLEYEFHLRTAKEAKEQESLYKVEGLGCYVINADWEQEAVCLDGTTRFDTLGRLVNHARVEPNLDHFHLVEVEPGHGPRLALFSTRFIPRGEELMWDYGFKGEEKDYPWINFQCPREPHPSFSDKR